MGEKLDLSPHQREVARCVVDGQGDKQIVTALGLSRGTVQTHLQRLYEKLKIHSRTELTVLACAAYRTSRAPGASPTGCPEDSRL